jgi:hypothetical protein
VKAKIRNDQSIVLRHNGNVYIIAYHNDRSISDSQAQAIIDDATRRGFTHAQLAYLKNTLPYTTNKAIAFGLWQFPDFDRPLGFYRSEKAALEAYRALTSTGEPRHED